MLGNAQLEAMCFDGQKKLREKSFNKNLRHYIVGLARLLDSKAT